MIPAFQALARRLGPGRVNTQRKKYREESPMLCGELQEQDTIMERK